MSNKRKIIFKILRHSRIYNIFSKFSQTNKVTILLFHDINKNYFNIFISYLVKNYNIISLSLYLESIKNKNKLPKNSLIITFDDGHKSNFSLLPIIKNRDIPLTIFLCSGIIGTNRHYWFKHKGLISKDFKKISNHLRLDKLSKMGFVQEEEKPLRHALSSEEIGLMDKYVDFQSHTIFHPCLPTCTDGESWTEIKNSKEQLETRINNQINAFSYPNGDYSDREINYCRDAGYECGITVDYGFNTLSTNPFKLKRISVNDTQNLDEFIVKCSGLWGFIKLILSKIKGEDLAEDRPIS